MTGSDPTRWDRQRRLGSVGFLLSLAVVVGLAAYVFLGSGRIPPAPPSPTPPLPNRPAPRPPVAWLGLNYNSLTPPGRLRDFLRRGIVYDREGSIEVNAGVTPYNNAQFRGGLSLDYSAGMVPVIEIDPNLGPPGCSYAPDPSKTCLPSRLPQIDALAAGLVRTMASVVRGFRHRQVLFEPLDEPWNWASPAGTSSSRRAAIEYAALLRAVLIDARAARVPLSDIYAAAVGQLDDGTFWVPDLYRAEPCLLPGPGSCGPIEGWYLHPYGPPANRSYGMLSVPLVRGQMRSGRENLIISEMGFCAEDVDGGKACDENRSDVDGTSRQTSRWLALALREGAAMHRAGWLRALLVWERSGSAWAMQNRDGTLTAQGRVLDLFAASPAGR
jgi:hypothetical protein